MIVLCGTDFSVFSRQAADTAARLARRQGDELLLVHVVEALGAELALGGPEQRQIDKARDKLQDEAERLRQVGTRVQTRLTTGNAADELARLSRTEGVGLLVVGALGQRSSARWVLGRVAEQAMRAASVPVLAVRSPDELDAWLGGEELPLEVLVGLDRTASSEAALRYLGGLIGDAQVEITVAQIVWPPQEHARLRLDPPKEDDRLLPEAEEVLLRDLRERVRRHLGDRPFKALVRPGTGSTDHDLALLADEQQADLLVVGNHQRKGLDRFWYGSVSGGALTLASTSVLAVPPTREEAHDEAPSLKTLLVPTDLSKMGNRAVPMAYAMARPGSTVHLLHVAEPPEPSPVLHHEPSHGVRGSAVKLSQLVSAEAEERGVITHVHVVEDEDVAGTLVAAAERLGADVICMGTRGRTGLGASLLGSVARKVMEKSRRPVLVIKPPEA